MSGTVLCTVDDHAEAAAAVEVARGLAERFDARILLVAVVANGARGDGRERAAAGDRLERIAAMYDLEHGDSRVVSGDPAEAVAVVAAEEAADVIVVAGRHGLLARGLQSAIATELAATAPCPVVVAVPDAAPAPRRARLAGRHA